MPIARILIAERAPGGHRLVYLRLLVDRAKMRGDEVSVVLSSSALQGQEFAKHLNELFVPVLRADSFSAASFLQDVERISLAQKVDHVVIPDGDAFAIRAGLLWRGPPLTCLIMRDPRGEAWGWRRRARNLVKSSGLTLVGMRRRLRLVWLAQYGDKPSRTRRVLAYDPYISSERHEDLAARGRDLREELRMASDTTWFAMVGALSRRKNINLVLDALGDVHASGIQVGLVLFGPHDMNLGRDLKTALEAVDFQVIVSDSLKSNEEINVMVHAADIVVTAYDIHYPNSTLVKALAAGTRVVVAGSSFVRRRATRTDVRVRHCALERASMSRALLASVNDPATSPRVDLGDRQFTDALLERWW